MKAVVIYVPPEVVFELLRQPACQWEVISGSLPNDATFHHAWFDHTLNRIALVIVSECFSEVYEGMPPPSHGIHTRLTPLVKVCEQIEN